MVDKLSWKRLILESMFFYIPWIIAGLLFDYMVWFLLVGTVIQLIWHMHNQMKALRWLLSDKRGLPPSGTGSWRPIFDGMYRLQKRHRRRRSELSGLIRRFRNGAEALPDAVIVFRAEGNIVWCNTLGQSLLGFRWPDDSGQPISNLVRNPEFIHYLQTRDFSVPLEMPSPLNLERTLELRIVPYTDGEHLMVVRDISKLKQLEGMRQNFLANVSHELRTPMTVLQGYLEMSKEPEILVGPMWVKAHGVMTEQLMRMNSLVKQLLTLSKIEAAPTHDLNEVVNIPAIIEILEKEAIALSGQESHVFTFNVDSSLKVMGDEDQLRSAISNLVYNAVKHTPAEANITVDWFRTPEGACFKVMDSGQGIAPQHIHHLTERFYRVDKARSRETGGSGLGLAIVKHALSHHDAQLSIESVVNQGATFSFVLPKRLISNAGH